MLNVASRIKMGLVVLFVVGVGILVYPIMDRNSENVWDIGINTRNQRQNRIRLVVEQTPMTDTIPMILYTVNSGTPKRASPSGERWARVIFMGLGDRVSLAATQDEPADFECRIENAKTDQTLDREQRSTRGTVRCRYAQTG